MSTRIRGKIRKFRCITETQDGRSGKTYRFVGTTDMLYYEKRRIQTLGLSFVATYRYDGSDNFFYFS